MKVLLFRNNANVKYWVNIEGRIDILFMIYIQTAEFAKSKLFLHLFTIPFSTYHGRRKLPKAGWASEGHNLPPLVQIGLTNLPKPEWAIAHPAHPSPTPLNKKDLKI